MAEIKKCLDCNGHITLAKDGTFGPHRDEDAEWCDGSGKWPMQQQREHEAQERKADD